MTSDLENMAWHRTMGKLIDRLAEPDFWNALIRVMNTYAPIDNWVVLIFSNDHVQVTSYPESADTEEKEAFLHRYLTGLYQLDPFYIANRENPQTGFFHLSDISPIHFTETEYYKLYFSDYVSVDEARRRQKLSATPDLPVRCCPYVLFRTQR